MKVVGMVLVWLLLIGGAQVLLWIYAAFMLLLDQVGIFG